MQFDLEHTTLFNGQVTVWQPTTGYRFALDSLVLAAFTPTKPNQSVLELGIGTGAASLALAFQHPDIFIHGVEIQSGILHITRKNIEANGWEDRFSVFEGSLTEKLTPGHFYDHVIMNPPFFTYNSYTTSPYVQKTLSHGENGTPLNEWILEAHRVLKSRGYLTIVHMAQRLDAILSLLNKQFGKIEIFPLWPKAGTRAKRVLIRARKGVKSPLKLHAGLILHNLDGSFTPEASDVIHHGKKISI